MKTDSWQWLMNRRFVNTILFFSLIALGAACTDEAINVNGPDGDASGASPKSYNTVPYDITNSSDGFIYTINLTSPMGAKDPSHLLLQFQDCDGTYLTGSYIESVTINDIAWPITYTTGQASKCSTGNDQPFIKLDNLTDRNLVIVVTLNTAAVSGSIFVKSGQSCSDRVALTSTYVCEGTTDICQTETAWAAGTRFIDPGNWATYTAYEGVEKSVTLWAGKNFNAGTVHFSAPDAVNSNMVTITITFETGWSLDIAKTEQVKIEGYNSTPPAENPSPGLFNTYKGNELVVAVPQFAFYGVHLDVQYSSAECDE